MSAPIVIVGGGHAAVQLCLALRKEKVDTEIILYSAEAELPYHRPPLSKAYITGKATDDKLPLRPESFYAGKNIDLRLNDAISAIDNNAKTVTGQSGAQEYSSLVLATGAVARPLPIEGRDVGGVFELRDLQDAKSIKAALHQTTSLVVIGAGFIGLEVAAAVNQMQGTKVTVFDTADRVMGRAVAPQISRWFEQTHRAAGIDIHLNESVSSILSHDGVATGVQRADGTVVDAELVLIGIGVLPNSDIAAAAGIQCENGVVVDQHCRTSDPHVYAAGDCANHPNPFADGRQLRLESIQNATDQARVIAGAIAAADNPELEAGPYNAVPWFWSDQAEHSLQMTGLSFDADQHLLRGDTESGAFSVFHYRGEKLLAVDSVNASRDHMLSRKLLTAGISPTFEQATDTQFDLMQLLKR